VFIWGADAGAATGASSAVAYVSQPQSTCCAAGQLRRRRLWSTPLRKAIARANTAVGDIEISTPPLSDHPKCQIIDEV